MELLKLDERLEEFVWQDVTFYFRTTVSSGDKFNLDTAGSLTEEGKVSFKPMEFYRACIRIFVTGWKGVTEKGKEVPYSFDTFSSRFPADPAGEDLFIKLGLFIAQKNMIIPKEEKALKNE